MRRLSSVPIALVVLLGVSASVATAQDAGESPASELTRAEQSLTEVAKFVSVDPSRVFESRTGEPGPGPKGKLPPAGTVDVQITGVGGVPAGAVSVVLNLTATDATARGFVTAYAKGKPRPATSNLNVTAPGQTRPNLAIVPIGDGGQVTFYSHTGTHLLADVWGYFVPVGGIGESTDGRLVPLDTPFRAFETRPGEPGPGPKGKVPPGGTIDVQVTGAGGVPFLGVSAVVMNITGTDATDRGFVSAWAKGQPQPATSALNLPGPGATAANLAIVPVGDGGMVSLFSQRGAHLLGDITGYITDATAPSDSSGLFVSMDPRRVFETRDGEPGPGPKGFVGAGETIDVLVDPTVGVPVEALAVALNLTGTEAARRGFVVGYPNGVTRPVASNLNLAGFGDTRANSAIIRIGDANRISFYSHTGAHLLADTSGYFTPQTYPRCDFTEFTVTGGPSIMGVPVVKPLVVPGDRPAIVELTGPPLGPGVNNFIVNMLDANGDTIADGSSVNEGPAYKGTKAINVRSDRNPVRQIRVDANGNWTAVVKPVCDAPKLTGTEIAGTSDAVIQVDRDGAAMFMHTGTSNFQVSTYQTLTERDIFIVNAIGNFSGTATIAPGTNFITIQARSGGSWTVGLPLT